MTELVLATVILSVVSCSDGPTFPCSMTIANRCWTYLGPSSELVTAIGVRGSEVWLGTAHGLYSYDRLSNRWRARAFSGHSVTSINAFPNGAGLWVTLSPGPYPDSIPSVAYRSDLTGTAWYPSDGGYAGTNHDRQAAFSLAFNPANINRLYLGTIQDILRSENGGATWTKVYSAGDTVLIGANEVAPIATSPVDAQRVWSGGQAVGGCPILLRSDDAGASWTRMYSIPDLGDPTCTLAPTIAGSLAPDPVDRNRLLVGMFGTVLVTPDSGVSWAEVLRPRNPGLVTLAYSGPSVIAVSDEEITMAPWSELGLYVGNEAGTTWDTLATPPAALGATALAVDHEGNVYIGTGGGIWVVRIP
ncbi:MAG TPA: hypothetical protein VFK78_10780 [Gemmatimonadales bacterium]|nr:hypothetical protein [Gemmatimonadales bacterium]